MEETRCPGGRPLLAYYTINKPFLHSPFRIFAVVGIKPCDKILMHFSSENDYRYFIGIHVSMRLILDFTKQMTYFRVSAYM